jgi:hypothetical protein
VDGVSTRTRARSPAAAIRSRLTGLGLELPASELLIVSVGGSVGSAPLAFVVVAWWVVVDDVVSLAVDVDDVSVEVVAVDVVVSLSVELLDVSLEVVEVAVEVVELSVELVEVSVELVEVSVELVDDDVEVVVVVVVGLTQPLL